MDDTVSGMFIANSLMRSGQQGLITLPETARIEFDYRVVKSNRMANG
jgi:hypothetical protein